MDDLHNITKLVKAILEEDMQTRNSDSYLYLKVLDYIAERDSIILAAMPVPYFLENMKHLGFPGFETVRRTRQKVQENHPELRACEKVEAARMENEKVFRAFARGCSE